MTFHIITLFPESFDSYIQSSIVGRAIKSKKVRVKFYNPRDFAVPPKGKKKSEWFYRQTDDKPYGGGPGMVMQAEPILRAAQAARRASGRAAPVIIFSPGGKQFTNDVADKVATKIEHLILICGRYEGIDARVKKILKATEWSVGPYVLTGGELPALIVLDAIARRLPGVLGKDESIEERRGLAPSLSRGEVYTRPEVLLHRNKRYRVPRVLLSGDHRKIEEWKRQRNQD
jgi:tRNA (guanine37-N1)-methyltransferase